MGWCERRNRAASTDFSLGFPLAEISEGAWCLVRKGKERERVEMDEWSGGLLREDGRVREVR